MGKKADLGTARAGETLGVFKGHEADWFLQWSQLADRVMDQAVQALDREHRTNAREAFLRACNYYRMAEYGCVPTHPRFRELWEKSVAAFHQACPLFNPPVQIVRVPFEGAMLPAYFWRPDGSGRKRPTLMVAGGNDDTEEEDFLIIGPAAVRRGYNVFIFGYPGHRGAVHTDPRQIKRPDYEVPFGAALDILEKLPGVDERIALMGFSGGGYVAPRVAIHDRRIRAVIPNNPMINYKRVADALLGPMVRRMPPFLLKRGLDRKLKRKPLVRAYMEYGLWTAGLAHMTLHQWLTSDDAQKDWARFNIEDDLHRITCPALALVGGGEGQEMIRQTEEFMEGISSTDKTMHVFTRAADGSHDHCMLDNVSRMQYVTFQWLNRIFDHHDTPPQAK